VPRSLTPVDDWPETELFATILFVGDPVVTIVMALLVDTPTLPRVCVLVVKTAVADNDILVRGRRRCARCVVINADTLRLYARCAGIADLISHDDVVITTENPNAIRVGLPYPVIDDLIPIRLRILKPSDVFARKRDTILRRAIHAIAHAINHVAIEGASNDRAKQLNPHIRDRTLRGKSSRCASGASIGVGCYGVAAHLSKIFQPATLSQRYTFVPIQEYGPAGIYTLPVLKLEVVMSVPESDGLVSSGPITVPSTVFAPGSETSANVNVVVSGVEATT
jgi:hypothetical protein